MAFINSFSSVIRKSNKEIVHIFENNGIDFNFYDKNNDLIKKAHINSKNPIDCSNCYFSLSKNDSIYGVYNEDVLKILEIKNNSQKILMKEIIEYNPNKFDILYPYIQVLNDKIHIFYYLFDNKSNTTSKLFHQYNKNGIWKKSKIDFIYSSILNNFEISFVNDTPIIFYLNTVGENEEIFFSKFDKTKLKWSRPFQITNSKKNKLYLGVLFDKETFHITFCESEDNLYCVKYINGNIDSKNNFNLNIYSFVSSPSICMFPNIIKENNDISILWVDFNKLFKSTTSNFGKTFTEPVVDEFSIQEDFCKSKFMSNYKNDFNYKSSNIFTIYKDFSIIGI